MMLCLTWQDVLMTGWNTTLIIVCIIICCYYILKYWIFPCQKNKHERQQKKDAFDREKKMKELNDLKESTDEALKKQNNDLEKEKSELESKLKTEKINNELLKRQLKIYREIFEDLKVDVKPKEIKS